MLCSNLPLREPAVQKVVVGEPPVAAAQICCGAHAEAALAPSCSQPAPERSPGTRAGAFWLSSLMGSLCLGTPHSPGSDFLSCAAFEAPAFSFNRCQTCFTSQGWPYLPRLPLPLYLLLAFPPDKPLDQPILSWHLHLRKPWPVQSIAITQVDAKKG